MTTKIAFHIENRCIQIIAAINATVDQMPSNMIDN